MKFFRSRNRIYEIKSASIPVLLQSVLAKTEADRGSKKMEDGEIDEEMAVEVRSQSSATPRKPEKSPYDMLKETKASVEEVAAKILSVKKENNQNLNSENSYPNVPSLRQSQTVYAQKEAFGEDIDLEIIGSMKDAQTFSSQQANKDGLSTSVESSRLEDDVPDEEDDGQRRRKRPKRVPCEEAIDQAGVYQVHPLKGSTEGPEYNILCNLFPDDTGLDLPHQSVKLFIGDGATFDEKRTSRPFKWAQHLAGIDFLPEVSPLLNSHEASNNEIKSDAVISGLALYRQQNRVQTVVQRIRSRIKAELALAEQLDSLMKLKWPALNCKSVPWALHVPLCSLHSWSSVGSKVNKDSSSQPIIDTEPVQEPMSDMDGRSGITKEELEGFREDGELPPLLSVPSATTKAEHNPLKGSNLSHSKQLALVSKSILSPAGKGKLSSFKKHDDSVLMLDMDSELDEPPETETENSSTQCYEIVEKTWVDYGNKEFILLLTRKTDTSGQNMTLEAKIKISMEYPLRPPLFSVNLYSSPGENSSENDNSGWHNEVRAMEAEGSPSSEKNTSSVIDVGLCKPVSGRLLARSFRGRDRRKMISWKDMECSTGYPF
ncbi:Abscisic acid responsive elements-binding factor 2 isoform 1 [Hibiscus syriacus]|uniref:Abscisic acid responsive elements-binding factor 2 isoform 1 n=1 Tax=Hibiscus syriacus TaxID=106335 RepID=A0A6A2WIG4_HIBSY|nr:Abscisic acid responsive elements-binding factor 2 isoform 1 [Hibiscus syriacus]